MTKCLRILLFIALFPSISHSGDTVFFRETFEDSDFSSRGWYDNTGLVLSSMEHIPGSTKSAEFHFLQGSTRPTSGLAIRKKFTDTYSVYVSYYVKYSSNWIGSGKSYHPHEFLVLTNVDDDWIGPAYTHLTAYIEQNEGIPLLAIQDSKNIDEKRVGENLLNITEQRDVAGCNGDSEGSGKGFCFLRGSVPWNGRLWKADKAYFQHAPGAFYKSDWHHIEAYYKLNSVVNGKGLPDGVIKYWFDGQLIIDHSDVTLRTGQYPDMKFNQFMIAPWIGDGSPIDQTFWVDDLIVASSR